MQRLALAIIVLVVLVVLLAAALSAIRRAISPNAPQDDGGKDMPQKVAFMLLIALIAYASTTGAP